MRRVSADIKGISQRAVWRVVDFHGLAAEWKPELRFLVRVRTAAELSAVLRIASSRITNVGIVTDDHQLCETSQLPGVHARGEAIVDGDVVALTPNRNEVHVLYRESDMHHTVFLTSRCNSLCLMCSQPPTQADDSWLIEEAISVAAHIRLPPPVIGFTGGEPLLLGAGLRRILDAFGARCPGIAMEVLTNGRLFADSRLARAVLGELHHRVTWMVPLYGHADMLHDFVVQSYGAFDETLAGLLTLRTYAQPVQLRTVLIEPTLRILPDLCRFIAMNLPFVREVALMGCESIGFALINREVCEVNIREWHQQLELAIRVLRRSNVPAIIMNLPLCALPTTLWPYAQRSISDWKREYVTECDGCRVRDDCSGLFAWWAKGWQPAPIRSVREVCQ